MKAKCDIQRPVCLSRGRRAPALLLPNLVGNNSPYKTGTCPHLIQVLWVSLEDQLLPNGTIARLTISIPSGS